MSTGDDVYELRVRGPLANRTWTNVGVRWEPFDGARVSDHKGGLEVSSTMEKYLIVWIYFKFKFITVSNFLFFMNLSLFSTFYVLFQMYIDGTRYGYAPLPLPRPEQHRGRWIPGRPPHKPLKTRTTTK